MRTLSCWIALLTILALEGALPIASAADDAFYDVPLSELKITSGQLPKREGQAALHQFDPRRIAMRPRVYLDGAGEAYVKLANDDFWSLRFRNWLEWPDWSMSHVLVRAHANRDIAGQLILPREDAMGMQRVEFTIPASAAKESSREAFYEAKTLHYLRLAQEPIAGTAWFRHEAAQAERKLKENNPQRISRSGAAFTWPAPSVTDAYDLFSGGRAMSESLQLDRLLREQLQSSQPTVDINTLQGITTAAIDWKPLLKGANPKLDPLSRYIPADQHAVFFPSFAGAVKLSDQAKTNDALLMRVAQPRSEDANVFVRYERQLGISMTTVGRLIGPAAIKRIALTGSDPYYATGTDVAVLFQTDHPDVLASLLKAQIVATSAKFPHVQAQSGEAGVKYQRFLSPDRIVSSYVAQLDGTVVVVANSPAQLRRLAKVGKGIDPISSLDEYKFFRTRYPLGDKNETALLFLSDATIRRWCSPRWRIASGTARSRLRRWRN